MMTPVGIPYIRESRQVQPGELDRAKAGWMEHRVLPGWELKYFMENGMRH